MRDKPRILFIVPLPPPVHGSAMVSNQIRCSKSINYRFESDFVNLSSSRRMEEIGRASFIKLIRYAGCFIKTLILLICHKYDACYIAITCHGKGFLKDAPLVLLCKLFRNKVILHQHNKGMSRDIDRFPYRKLIPFVYNNTSVILLSERLIPDIDHVKDRVNIFICPNGIDDFKHDETARNRGITEIVFLSNLIVSKGVYDLLDACSMLKSKGLVFHCTMAGNPTDEISKEKLESEILSRNIENEVNYVGPKYGHDKESVLNNADIFAFPTYYDNETFGLVIVEAMKHGIPVVSTEEGGIPDIIRDGENGFICKQRDSGSLANCLERLISDPELRNSMGQKGREIFEKEYTTTVFEERLTAILDEIIK